MPLPTPPTQLPLSAPPHRNQQLFSDHFLDAALPRNTDWQLLAAYAQVIQAKLRIVEMLTRFKPSANEAQTEQDLVRPVLDALGHTYEVQPALTTPDGAKRPDYVLYRDVAARGANKNRQLNEALLRNALAVGDAKYWDRPLDVAMRTSSDPFSNKNPTYQIAFYVQHSGVDWGVLTNGRLWRLYHKDTAHKLDRFYEVDLPAVIASDDPQAFLYFWAFFNRAAFEPAPPYGAVLGLSAMLRASQDYARGVSDTLKAQVYEALRHLAQGLLDHPQNRLSTDPASLKTIYDNGLTVLYRLLFILYAEARELLPVRENAAYRDEYSLRAIKEEVKRNLDGGRQLLPTTKRIWQKLDELFDIINLGSPPLKVSTFNGGLFDPAKHPFLQQHAVGDAHLQWAIDKLARVDGEFIDYRDLAERHLGTIYEGLLEFTLVPSPLGGEGQGEGVGGVRDAFTIDLVNDKGERKATGSYYTPDFIVKYIVDQAVGPALRQATASAKTDADKVKAVLALNVLDPAMGSGHFLVEVVEYIARYLVDLGIAPPQTAGSPSGVGGDEGGDLAYWKRRVAQSCVYGVDLNPLAVELAKLSLWLVTVAKDRPLSFLDHHLRAGNSLVGAKLDDVRQFALTPKKRTRKSAANTEAQVQMFSAEQLRQDMFTAVGSMFLIEDNPALTVDDVKLQEQTYLALRDDLTRKYKLLADLMTSERCGLALDPALLPALAARATGRSSMAMRQIDEVMAQAEAMATERRFFHWEIEFPEVFFDRAGEPQGEQAGFDAVVGNPPYVRQEQLAPFKPYFQSAFASYHSTADLYLYFFERALQLAQVKGRVAYITSGTFARANFAMPFRKWLPEHAQIQSLIDFGENQPFEGAEMVRPTIAVLGKEPTKSSFRALFIAGRMPASLDDAVNSQGIDCLPESLEQSEWTFQSANYTSLLNKLLKRGKALGELVNGQIYRGILTGLNEAFIVDQTTRDHIVAKEPHSASVLKRILRGEDLRPWYQEDEGRWLIAFPAGWTRLEFGEGVSEQEAWSSFVNRFPTLSSHLSSYAEAGQKRLDKGEYWWELRPCNYYEAFDRPKILWPDIGKLPRCSWDVEAKFINNKAYIVPCDDMALLAILQSRVNWYAISQLCTPLRLRAGLWQYQQFVQFTTRLPIPDMTDAQRGVIADLALRITEQAQARYALHRAVRDRIASDLASGSKLNQKLTAWWDLPSFAAFRAEVKKAFKADVPLAERDDWERWLAERRVEHARFTAEIVRLETELNAQVYALFDLTPDEIALIEASTKYRYGEV